MSVIATVEDALIGAARDVLGARVRHYESLPGGWTIDALKRALQFAPGVYAAFLGASRGQVLAHYPARFAVYCVTRGVADTTRRRGGPAVIGAYDIIEALVPVLDGLVVPGVGGVRVTAIDNVFSEATFDLGGTVYGIQAQIADLPLERLLDAASLDDFVTFDARYDIDTAQAGDPLAEDQVTGLDKL